MKKIVATLVFGLVFIPSVSFAAALTSQQSSSLIAVVQSSPGTPASAFVSLITAFSNITVNQAASLITVVQSAPSAPASAFVNLLISFTVDAVAVQPTAPVVTPAIITPPTQNPQPVPTSAQSCTQDTWSCSDWLGCSSSGSQIRTCNKTFECSSVATPSPTTSQSCTPSVTTCASFTYSAWGACQSNSTQSRSLTSSSPSGCTGGSPSLSQSCTYTPPVIACTSFTYSAWGSCQSNNMQSRTLSSSLPSGCTGGSPVLSQSCTYVPPVIACTSFTYSDWGSCQSNSTQSRSLTSSSPSGCTGGSPSLSQSCTYTPPVVYSDYNFNYQWTPWIGSGSTLSCPVTPRNIVIKKAVFKIPDSELQKITTLQALEADGFKIVIQPLSTFHARRSDLSLSGTYSLEEMTPNTFVYFGGDIPICGNGGVVSISDVQGSFMDIVDGRNVKIYLAQKGVTMDVESIANGVSFYLLVSPIMAEWEVWDYTTNKPVKIL